MFFTSIHEAILPLLMLADPLCGPNVAQYKRYAEQKVS